MKLNLRLLASAEALAKRGPKNIAKILLGSIALLIITIIFLKIFTADSESSNFTLQSRENKFRVNFNIAKNDQIAFSQILEKLNVQKDAKKGFAFELDGTSSARLTFASPINASFNIKKDTINFEGESTRHLVQEQFLPQNFKIPESTNLAIAASNFKDFVKSKSPDSKEFESWLDNNLNSLGQYLVIFGKAADFAVIFKKDSIDFDSLKNVQILGEPIYYKESNQNIDFHILKFPKPDGQSMAFTIFQIANKTYLASSYDGAQELLRIEKNEKEVIEFPNLPPGQDISLTILYQNSNQYSPEDNFFKLLFDDKPQVKNTLQKVRKLELTLKSNRFSGLISLQ